MKNDVLFLKKLFEITTLEEINDMIKLSDSLDLTSSDEQRLELFFIKAGKHFGSLYDAFVGICENFDFDLDLVLMNTYLLDKLSAEKKGINKMEEFFV